MATKTNYSDIRQTRGPPRRTGLSDRRNYVAPTAAPVAAPAIVNESSDKKSSGSAGAILAGALGAVILIGTGIGLDTLMHKSHENPNSIHNELNCNTTENKVEKIKLRHYVHAAPAAPAKEKEKAPAAPAAAPATAPATAPAAPAQQAAHAPPAPVQAPAQADDYGDAGEGYAQPQLPYSFYIPQTPWFGVPGYGYGGWGYGGYGGGGYGRYGRGGYGGGRGYGRGGGYGGYLRGGRGGNAGSGTSGSGGHTCSTCGGSGHGGSGFAQHGMGYSGGHMGNFARGGGGGRGGGHGGGRR